MRTYTAKQVDDLLHNLALMCEKKSTEKDRIADSGQFNKADSQLIKGSAMGWRAAGSTLLTVADMIKENGLGENFKRMEESI